MNRDISLISYLPPVIKELKEIEEITKVEDPEIQQLFDNAEKVLNDTFIEDCNISGIKRFEKILKITPFATDTLKDRQFRVLTKWNDSIPYTWRMLIRKLDILFGRENYKIDRNFNEHILSVDIKTFNWQQYYEIIDNIRKIIPVTLVLNTKLIQELTGNVFYGSYMTSGETITVYPWQAREIETKANVNIGLANNISFESISVYPKKEEQ